MSSSPASNGVIELSSKHSVLETADRLESILTGKGLTIFSRIDQAEAAQAVGLTMRPMILLIFGDPKAGTPLMLQYPSLAIDLPLKALIWEAGDGDVRLSYNSPEYLQERHGLANTPFVPVGNLLQQATQ